MTVSAQLDRDITPKGDDYDLVRQTIERISLDYRAQPSLEQIASDLGVAPGRLQKTFSRWAGLTPKAFLQAVTLDHARRLLGDEGLPLLDASYELGLSGPGRLHDLFVTHEAMSPGDFKTGGAGLAISYGFHPSPFGTAVIMATERGLVRPGLRRSGRREGSARGHDQAMARRKVLAGPGDDRALRQPDLLTRAVARRPAA
jgi:AraC family transcriptional regulator of adaptative response/methylated-DNA-[protein]-cysteine methyltransferase